MNIRSTPQTAIHDFLPVKRNLLYLVLLMANLQHYRQPIVTATGIFLGFMLNYASAWIKDAFTKNMFRDIVLGLSIIVSISLLLIVLFRILRMKPPTDKVDVYYSKTLRLFIIGVSVPFLAFVLVVIRTIIVNAGRTVIN